MLWAQAAWEGEWISEEPRTRYGGVLDSARMSTLWEWRCKVSVEKRSFLRARRHGDDRSATRYSTVAGIPLPDLLPKERIDAIVERTRKAAPRLSIC